VQLPGFDELLHVEMAMNNTNTIDRIRAIKTALGERLIILAHHYQRKEIIALADAVGDSYGLSKTAAEDDRAEYIVFCGVHFMAESAEILSKPGQTVQIPDEEAGCWMADMADIVAVEKAWEELSAAVGGNLIPVVYMNAEAAIKAFCGRNGGIVCTSSNAVPAFRWAYERGRKIFFFPDQHLGRNTANQMGFGREDTVVWRPGEYLGGNTSRELQRAKLVLWEGHCLVHTRFTEGHIAASRKQYPRACVVVHPECTERVVALADAVGSTSFIVDYVKNTAAGETVIIGTEINLVKRLASENRDKTILPLYDSLCPNMYKINPEKLLYILENIGTVNIVTVPDRVKSEAARALDRMLELSV
jgi:quinolinate synthase